VHSSPACLSSPLALVLYRAKRACGVLGTDIAAGQARQGHSNKKQQPTTVSTPPIAVGSVPRRSSTAFHKLSTRVPKYPLRYGVQSGAAGAADFPVCQCPEGVQLFHDRGSSGSAGPVPLGPPSGVEMVAHATRFCMRRGAAAKEPRGPSQGRLILETFSHPWMDPGRSPHSAPAVPYLRISRPLQELHFGPSDQRRSVVWSWNSRDVSVT